LKLVFDMF